MKRKSRKIDTSKKRCRELQKFRVLHTCQELGNMYYPGDIFTFEGVYKYGMHRLK